MERKSGSSSALRDFKGVPLAIEVIRFSIELRWIWSLERQKGDEASKQQGFAQFYFTAPHSAYRLARPHLSGAVERHRHARRGV
jgi:hypothetical protein